MAPEPAQNGRTVTVSLPFALRKRGGRKRIIAPEGAPAWVHAASEVDGTLVKAIARAYRWQTMLEEGRYASISELAHAERINPSYLARVLRLTLLAPDIVEQVLAGANRLTISLETIWNDVPASWEEQRTMGRR